MTPCDFSARLGERTGLLYNTSEEIEGQLEVISATIPDFERTSVDAIAERLEKVQENAATHIKFETKHFICDLVAILL